MKLNKARDELDVEMVWNHQIWHHDLVRNKQQT